MHVVWTQEDVLDESLAFKPQFTHQVFGEKEAIFGYKDLKIKVLLLHGVSTFKITL